ncbi:MAG: TonB-dependent receptor P3 [Parabacteroides distasonis]
MKKRFYDFTSVKRLCVGMSLCCMVAGAQAAPTSSAFDQRFDVEFSLNNTTLKTVVNSLKKQTDIVFSYDTSLESLRVNNVSVKAENEKIEAILDQAFRGTGIKYKIEDRIVMLYSGKEPSAKANATQQSTKKISGIVKDPTGIPVIGANVVVKGTTNGVITGLDGDFQLEVPENATLEISYIGYMTQSISVSGKKTFNITLNEDTQKLDEVVVLGYGAGQRKQDLSASVGVLNNTEDLVARPVTSTESMLQGQLAGVTVQANGGDPTATPSIVIRGQGSQNGDNVLWVVDGVPGAPIASMNDIETIVVLKDAASAAIYGAQSGAGGVILVTTKKAKEGKTSLSYDATFGIRKASNVIEPLNAEEQLEMRKLSYANAGLTLPTGWDLTKNPWVGTTRTNWMDEIFRTAFYQRHNVALNVGSENASNRVSFAYDNDEGVLVNTFNKNLSLRYNGKFKLNKWVTITEDVVWKNNESRSKDTDSGYTGVVAAAMYMPASATVYNPLDGTYGGTTTEDPDYIAKYGSNFADIHGDAVNPVRLLKAENRYNRTSDIWSTTSLELANIVTGLKFTSRFTYNLKNNLYKNFSPIRDEVGKPSLTNNLDETTYRADAWKTENTLTYDNTFNDMHTVGVLLSTTADHYSKRGLEVNGKDLSDESAYLQYLSYANSVSATDYLTGPDANVSLIARLAYSFNDRYFVTASWRRDYAGRLPKDNNYGDFPAVTAGWKISNESFFPKSETLNLLKIRASWGRVGNLGSIGYNYKSALLGKNYWSEQAQYGVESNKIWGNFIYNSTALNPNLTWETSEQWDLGLDVDMFDNRLSMAFDYFDKRTFNLIQSQTMNWPGTIGIDAMLVNQGEIRNRGFEAQINWNQQVNKDWSYFVSGNFSYLKNWVSDIGVKNTDGTPGVWTGDGRYRNLPYMYQTAEGEPLGSFYLIKTDGIFQSDAEAAAYVNKDGKRIQPDAVAGDLKFVDANGDGVINDEDRQYCGSATPKTTFSFSGGFTWKKLSVSAMFQGVGGAQALYVGKYMALSDVEGNFNRSKEIMNAWSPSNTGSNIPRLSKNDPNSNFSTPSDWYLENASYLRLKNFTVSYDLSDVIRKCAHLQERNSMMSVYLSGENLFTITNYSGMDPETGGWDALKYPVSRVFSVGVKLTY